MISAISVATITTMPNQTRSKPCAATTGANSGTKIRMIAIESITQPSTRNTARIAKTSETLSSPVDCARPSIPAANPDNVSSFESISAPKSTE